MTTKSHSSRRSYVCDQCYRCKVQCSKEQPSCKRCQKADRPCTYSLGLWKGRSRDLQRGSQDKEKSIEPTTKTGSKDPNQQDTQRSFNNFRLQDEHAITSRVQPLPNHKGEVPFPRPPLHGLTEAGELELGSSISLIEPFLEPWDNGGIITMQAQSARDVEFLDPFSNLQVVQDPWYDDCVSLDVDHDFMLNDHHARSPEEPTDLSVLSSLPSTNVSEVFHKQPEIHEMERCSTSQPTALLPDWTTIPTKSDHFRPRHRRPSQRVHPYKRNGRGSDSADSTNANRKTTIQGAPSATDDRSLSPEPPSSTAPQETTVHRPGASISGLPGQSKSDTFRCDCSPSANSIVSSNTRNSSISTTSSLESLYIFPITVSDSPTAGGLLGDIQSALSVCEQVITCHSSRTRPYWAGVRCLLVFQEVHTLLRSVFQPNDTEQEDTTTGEIHDKNRFRGEVIRAIMLIAGLETLQFPSDPRISQAEVPCADILNWKIIAADLSCRLKMLLEL